MMVVVVSFEDLEDFLACPKRFFKNLPKKERMNFHNETFSLLLESGFSVEKPVVHCRVQEIELVAMPDFVVKEADGWRIILKKAAKRFKDKYSLEASFNAFVFSQAGWNVSSVEVHSDHFVRKVENWRTLVPLMTSAVASMSKLDSEPMPSPNRTCRHCEFIEDCERELLDKKSLLLVNGIGKETEKVLKGLGINDLEDLAAASDEKLVGVFGPERAKRLIYSARSFLEERVIVLEKPEKMPEGIVLDVENYPPDEIDFLYGFLVRNEYRYFLVDNLQDEDRVVEFLESLPKGSPVYHYHGPEQRKVDQLFRKRKKKFFGNFIDVYTVLRKHFVLPVFSYSLKRVAKLFGYQWRTNLNGYAVVNLYEKWVETREESIINLILQYNEDDVRATKVVIDFINSHSSFS